MKNYDMSLLEVWEWKEKVYQDIKNMTPKNYIKKISDKADKILSENKINLESVDQNKAHSEVV